MEAYAGLDLVISFQLMSANFLTQATHHYVHAWQWCKSVHIQSLWDNISAKIPRLRGPTGNIQAVAVAWDASVLLCFSWWRWGKVLIQQQGCHLTCTAEARNNQLVLREEGRVLEVCLLSSPVRLQPNVCGQRRGPKVSPRLLQKPTFVHSYLIHVRILNVDLRKDAEL